MKKIRTVLGILLVIGSMTSCKTSVVDQTRKSDFPLKRLVEIDSKVDTVYFKMDDALTHLEDFKAGNEIHVTQTSIGYFYSPTQCLCKLVEKTCLGISYDASVLLPYDEVLGKFVVSLTKLPEYKNNDRLGILLEDPGKWEEDLRHGLR